MTKARVYFWPKDDSLKKHTCYSEMTF